MSTILYQAPLFHSPKFTTQKFNHITPSNRLEYELRLPFEKKSTLLKEVMASWINQWKLMILELIFSNEKHKSMGHYCIEFCSKLCRAKNILCLDLMEDCNANLLPLSELDPVQLTTPLVIFRRFGAFISLSWKTMYSSSVHWPSCSIHLKVVASVCNIDENHNMLIGNFEKVRRNCFCLELISFAKILGRKLKLWGNQ